MALDHCAAVEGRLGEVEMLSRPVRPASLPLLMAREHVGERIYPYRAQTDIDFENPQPRVFRTVELENEFLRLVVLPELGGRLHRAIFKPTGYDLFYHNPEIRAELVAIRGAWYAGGVEFNFPVSHNLTTHSGVDYDIQRFPDGSAAICVSNTDRVSHMRWLVRIRLYPGCSTIHFATRLINLTPWPKRYYYWLNAAVPQGPQIRYHFSASRAVGHVQEADIVTTSLNSWPVMSDGQDARRPHAMRDTVSVFMVDNSTGFFGYYDVDAKLGLVRSADPRNVPGDKIFSWGDNEYGRRFNDRLVGKGRQWYGEMQSGRPETQIDWGYIEPFEVMESDEYWYPVPGLCELAGGSNDLAVGVDAAAGRLRVAGHRPMTGLTLRLQSADTGKPLAEHKISRLSPAQPLDLPLPSGNGQVRVTATDGGGRLLLDHRPGPPRRPLVVDLYENKASLHRRRQPLKTAHELTERAVTLLRQRAITQGEQMLATARELEPDFSPALRWSGWLAAQRGRLDAALDFFRKAFFADGMDYASYYFYALTLLESGRAEEAADELERVVGYVQGQYREWASLLLVRALRASGRLREAERLLDERVAAVAFGALGRQAYLYDRTPDERSAFWSDPTDLVLLIVCADDVGEVLDEWWTRNIRPLDEAADAIMEVADEFRVNGDDARARGVLTWLTAHPRLGGVCPLAHYRLGQLNGRLADAVAQAARRTDRNAMAWPARTSDEALLSAACQAAPGDALAHYLLGLLLMGLERLTDALAPIQRATELDAKWPLAWRGLGLIRYGCDRPWQESWEAYQKALALWPDSPALIAEADRALDELNGPADLRRGLLYDNLPASLVNNDKVVLRRAILATVCGDYEHALAEIARTRFYPGEFAFGPRNVFAQASRRLGERRAAAGDWSGAADAFRQSLDFPEHLGTGRTLKVRLGKELYLVGIALERLGDAAGAREHFDQVVRTCRFDYPDQSYFAILSLRKLGRQEEEAKLMQRIVDRAAFGAPDRTEPSVRADLCRRAFLARARGDRAESDRLLGELNLPPGDDMAEFLTTKLY
ncbi:MAG: hypothetical protein BIFFINMI_01636 [Phycisphaerae bacterium]|nr:hypothetical protein [Phycisphaerae bacterium]